MVFQIVPPWSKSTGLMALLFMFTHSVYAQESQSASLIVELNSDSVETRGKHYLVTRYADTSCSRYGKGSRLLRKRYAKNTHLFQMSGIVPDQPFVFQVNYNEARRNEERACSYLISFTPQAARNYKATYKVINDVSKCGIAVSEVELAVPSNVETENPMPEVLFEKGVELIVPEKSCKKNKLSDIKNGVPVYAYEERLKY